MKKISTKLLLGIILLPFLYALLPLRPSYSKKARILSISYLIIIPILVLILKFSSETIIFVFGALSFGIPIQGVIIGYSWVIHIRDVKRNKKREAYKKELSEHIEKNGLVAIDTHFILKHEEYALIESSTVLLETRAVRHSSMSGGSVRISRGLSIHSGRGTSYSTQEYQEVDKGTVLLTTDRIIFDGDKGDRSIHLKNIVSVKGFIDGIEISSEDRVKSMIFRLRDPIKWTTHLNYLFNTRQAA